MCSTNCGVALNREVTVAHETQFYKPCPGQSEFLETKSPQINDAQFYLRKDAQRSSN